jgi:uncharacterized SAM-binding protein YcdF (DUF218 family)
MYLLNKIAWGMLNPAFLGCLLAFSGLFVLAIKSFGRRGRQIGICLVGCATLWFYIWATPMFTKSIGATLERDFLVGDRWPDVSNFPVCDVIADMGGGIGASTNVSSNAYLNSSADRAYFSSLLWKAGKAPIIMPSGKGLIHSDRRFLLDLAVPETAIVVENRARNTEENAKFVGELVVEEVGRRKEEGGRRKLEGGSGKENLEGDGLKPKVLVVTSAWHMKRTLLMFEKYAPQIEVIPAACDFECVPTGNLQLTELLPNAEVFGRNAVYFHEWIGIFWYRIFRQ